jgi:hypothetical protein
LYDPWLDYNDDGVINIYDVVAVTSIYGSTGTPINHTACKELEARVEALETKIPELEAKIDSLNASLADLEARVNELEAKPYAIRFNSTFTYYADVTTETMNWVDMDYMSVTITLNRTSYLLIMFSAEAMNNLEGKRIAIRALVDGQTAYPNALFFFTPYIHDSLGWPYTHSHVVDYMSYTYNFLMPSVSQGTHTVKIQWGVTGGTGYVDARNLIVIALPT